MPPKGSRPPAGCPWWGSTTWKATSTPTGSAKGRPPRFPLLCLVVSGGHTELVLMTAHGHFAPLGRTRDDAAGEAFDKVARILGLGYPGGPAVEGAAGAVDPASVPRSLRLTRPWLRGSDDFSFSGLKTAVLRLAQGDQNGPVGNPSRPVGLTPHPPESPPAAPAAQPWPGPRTAARRRARLRLPGGGGGRPGGEDLRRRRAPGGGRDRPRRGRRGQRPPSRGPAPAGPRPAARRPPCATARTTRR